MKRQRPVKKLQLSSETLLRLDQFPLVQGGVLAGTLTFEGTLREFPLPRLHGAVYRHTVGLNGSRIPNQPTFPTC